MTYFEEEMTEVFDEEVFDEVFSEEDFYEENLYKVKTRTKYIDPQTAMYRLYDRLAEAGAIW